MLSNKLEFTAEPHNLVLIHEVLEQFEQDATGLSGEAVATIYDAFRTAAIEIATNIFRHAYPPGDSGATLTFQIFLFEQRLEAIFYDQGIAFKSPEDVSLPALDELDDITEMPEGNFGLFLALQALDHLDYSRSPDGVNQWRLIKSLA